MRSLLHPDCAARRADDRRRQDLSFTLLLEAAFSEWRIEDRFAGIDDHRKCASMNNLPEFSAALLGFNAEAVVYCQGISETVAHDYAMDYARMLQNRAKGIDVSQPRFRVGLFEPNRKLIRSTLERMSQKYFPQK